MTLFDPGAPITTHVPSGRVGDVGRAILHYLQTHDAVSPTEAGMICHERRRILSKAKCGVGAKTIGDRSAACCAYAAADGLSALNRLKASGYVVKTARGRYEPTVRPSS